MIIVLPFLPPSINGAYYTDRHSFSRHKSKAYKEFILKCYSHMVEPARVPVAGPAEVEINLYFDTKRKNDIDNRIKPLLDTLTHYGIYKDDSQIVRLLVEKYYAKGQPKTVIEIIEKRENKINSLSSDDVVKTI